MRRSSVSPRAVVGWTVAVVVVAGASFWAGSVVAAPPATVDAAPALVGYQVAEGEVGQSQQFTAQAQWPVVTSQTSPASGVITGVSVPEDGTVTAGMTLYSVDMQPVVAVPGAVPAYRDLASGTRGEDVRQLQQFLVDTRGASLRVDGTFGASTVTAVRAWQRELGVDPDGVVGRGDVMFLPELPARMVPAADLIVGRSIAQGDDALDVLGSAPEFVLQLSVEQVTAVPQDAQIVVQAPAGDLTGVFTSTEDREDGTVLLRIGTADGGPVCGADCGWVPLPGPTNVPVQVVIVPKETGPVVPVAAITTRADGTTWVERTDQEPVQVQVLVSTGGLAVVSGIEAGDEVLIPAGTS